MLEAEQEHDELVASELDAVNEYWEDRGWDHDYDYDYEARPEGPSSSRNPPAPRVPRRELTSVRTLSCPGRG